MGATSRLSTLITGLFLLLCMVVLGPIVGLIPMVVLASVLVTVSLSTFDRRTFKYIQSSPIQNASVILLTMALILWTHNLAVGVIIGTIFYYLMNYFIKKVG